MALPITGGLIVHLDASTGITKNIDNKVSLWEDQSGNGNDFSQSEMAHQPVWGGNSLLNNKPSIEFDGTKWLDGNNLGLLKSLDGCTVVAVLKLTSEQSPGPLFQVVNNDPNYRDVMALYWEYGDPAAVAANSDGVAKRIQFDSYSTRDITFYAVRAGYNGGVLSLNDTLKSIEVESGTSYSANTSGSSDHSYVRIGRDENTPGPSYVGWLSELIVYNRVLTDNELSQLSSYLEDKYLSKYYIDLSSVTDGHAGTTGDPYSFNDWVDLDRSVNIGWPNPPTDTVYYFKGSVTTSKSITFYQQRHLPWDAAVNGPWRINTSSTVNSNFNHGVIQGAILKFSGSSNLGSSFCNSYLISSENISHVGKLSGCIVKCDGTISFDQDPIDSVIQADSYSGTVTYYNCAININQNNKINCKIWNGTLPAYDADKRALNTSEIFKDIVEPVQPGYGYPSYLRTIYSDSEFPAYTEYYNKDLYNNSRTGIGTGFMELNIGASIENMYINCKEFSCLHSFGSLIKCAKMKYTDGNDNVIQATGGYGTSGDMQFSNCAFNAASLPSGYTAINSQLNYSVSGETPGFTADAATFYSNAIYGGLNEPPSPGFSPYNSMNVAPESGNYGKDLWGNIRTEIGACCLPPINYFDPAPAVHSHSVSTIDSDVLIRLMDPLFPDIHSIFRVDIRYDHEEKRQMKIVSHFLTHGVLQGTVSWTKQAKKGWWYRTEITIIGFDGTKRILVRGTDFGSDGDIYI